MPFPINRKYIEETETKLNIKLPQSYIDSMMSNNGGTIIIEDDYWDLYPILDKSDNKRISRTCNDIIRETSSAREWAGFPGNAIAIANNGSGDQLILIEENDTLLETIYIWSH